ncbi:MAG: hypothetical protein ACK4YP_11865 [Myxococcota bacterium]
MELEQAFSPTRAIAHGFAGLRRAPAGMLVGGFLMFLVTMLSGGTGGGGNLQELAKDQDPEVSLALLVAALGLMAVGIVIGLIFFVARCFLLPGWIRLLRHIVETGTDDLPKLFSGGDALLRMIGWRFLDGFIRFGTFIVAAIPGLVLVGYGLSQGPDLAWVGAGATLVAFFALPVSIYVGLGLRLGDQVVALEGLGPIAALDRSWELARGHRLTLWVFFLVTDLFSLLGMFFCFIGLFVTRAIADLGVTEAFLLATVPETRDAVLPREEGL